jgi:hypothetical protein
MPNPNANTQLMTNQSVVAAHSPAYLPNDMQQPQVAQQAYIMQPQIYPQQQQQQQPPPPHQNMQMQMVHPQAIPTIQQTEIQQPQQLQQMPVMDTS